MKNYAERLRLYLKETKTPQLKFAIDNDVSSASVSAWLKGVRPVPKFIRRIIDDYEAKQ